MYWLSALTDYEWSKFKLVSICQIESVILRWLECDLRESCCLFLNPVIRADVCCVNTRQFLHKHKVNILGVQIESIYHGAPFRNVCQRKPLPRANAEAPRLWIRGVQIVSPKLDDEVSKPLLRPDPMDRRQIPGLLGHLVLAVERAWCRVGCSYRCQQNSPRRGPSWRVKRSLVLPLYLMLQSKWSSCYRIPLFMFVYIYLQFSLLVWMLQCVCLICLGNKAHTI